MVVMIFRTVLTMVHRRAVALFITLRRHGKESKAVNFTVQVFITWKDENRPPLLLLLATILSRELQGIPITAHTVTTRRQRVQVQTCPFIGLKLGAQSRSVKINLKGMVLQTN